MSNLCKGHDGPTPHDLCPFCIVVREKEEMRSVIRDILSNVSLDWYVQQFGKDETPRGNSTGIVAKIHNRETLNRIAAVFERARRYVPLAEQNNDSSKA